MTTPNEDTGDESGENSSLSAKLTAKCAVWQLKLDAYADWLGSRLPWVILAFFAAQAFIRMLLSGNLEVDEAQFVGETGFRPGFDGSHPPLYNWLVTGALWLTGGSWVASVALVKNALLAGHFILIWDLVRRLRLNPVAGLGAAAALTLLPQIVWMGQVTLAHSVAVGFATLASLHAASMWLVRRDAKSAVWLGVAVSIGVLSKYNFLIFWSAFMLAVWVTPGLRVRVDWRTAWLASGVALVLCGPHLVWAITHLGVTTARLGKLYSERDGLSAFDIPLLGVDGLLSLALALLAWGGALAFVWTMLIRREPKALGIRSDHGWTYADEFATGCGRAALIGFGLLALVVLFADMHKVHERYLTPLLLPGVVWLVVRFPLKHGRGVLAWLATALLIASMIAIPATVAFGPSRLAYPYVDIAGEIAASNSTPEAVLAHRHDLAANIALRLPNAKVWSGLEDRVLLIWRRDESAPGALKDRLGEGFSAASEVVYHDHLYRNWSAHSAQLRSQMYVRH